MQSLKARLRGAFACVLALFTVLGAMPAQAQAPAPVPAQANAPAGVQAGAPASVMSSDAPPASVPAPAAINPQDARITDSAIRADRIFIATQLERARLLNESGIQPFSAYHFAKAVHWIEFAFDEYEMKNRSGVIEAALAEGTRLLAAMENRQADLPMDTALIAGATRVRLDLWNAAARFKADTAGFRCSGGDVARMEVQLVWAGYIQHDMGWRSARPYLQAAERYYRDALAAAETCPVVAAEPRRLPEEPALAQLAPAEQIEVLADRVHFAYDSANIAVPSAPVLDRIASVLRANPAIGVTIEGHADERGGDSYNLRLSQRRADAVRNYLAAAGIERARMQVMAYGKSRPEVPAVEAQGYAVNRRVVIIPSTRQELKLNPQRDDLQVEQRPGQR